MKHIMTDAISSLVLLTDSLSHQSPFILDTSVQLRNTSITTIRDLLLTCKLCFITFQSS